MEHIAIMKKSWKLTEKILTGEKKIESRWYMNKYHPWNTISPGDMVYFKNSGEPVTIAAETSRILRFSDLNPQKVRELLKQYGKADGIEKKDIPFFMDLFKNKKYCMLMFLKNPRKIRSFNINKKGYGMMSAWISIDNVNKIRVK